MKNKEDRKPNVLHICSWYPNKLKAYDGNFIHKHIKTIKDVTNSFVLAVYEDPNLKNSKTVEKREITDGVYSLIIYHKSFSYKILNILFRFYLYYKGFRAIKKELGSINLIHAHVFLYAGIFTWLLNIIYRIPYVITEHSTEFHDKELSFFKKFLLKNAARKSKMILPVSNDLINKLKAFGIEGNYSVVANVVDCNLFQVKDNMPSTQNLRFLHISNFSENKNIEGILKAIEILNTKRKDFSLTIAGDGDINSLQKKISEKVISDELIQIHGTMPEREVAEMMKEHNAFLLFSHRENLPCVLIEALACGLPLISTAVGGVTEIIRNEKTGILIEDNKVEQLVTAMEFMLENYALYDPFLIREYAENNYSEKTIKVRLLEVYQSVLKY